MIVERAKEEADIIVGQRVCIEGASKTWHEMKAQGRKLVFEVDDDLWSVHKDNEIAHKFFADSDIRRRLAENATVADLVTVTNEHLQKILLEFNDNVAILPNYIDASTLTFDRKHNERLTVGWSGSASHLPDFQGMAPRLARFLKRNDQLDMHFIGANYESLLRVPCRWTDWSEEVAQYHTTIDFDIGVIPLAPNHFNRSKSYIKALEYGALGIPVVASKFGPYEDFVKHGVTGFLVQYDHEWEKYLNMLAHDEAMRLEMGEAARRQASEFTIQYNMMQWVEAYASLIPHFAAQLAEAKAGVA
jgi:glycosyltransferase involved in cell wall biosynthesis